MLHSVDGGDKRRLAGIPKQFWDADKRKLTNEKLRAFLGEFKQEWEERLKDGKGVFACGDPGVGKSYLAAKITLFLIKKKKKVRWIKGDVLANFTSLCWEAKASHNQGQLLEIRKKWKELLSCSLLVIDDLNREGIPNNSATEQSLRHTIKWRVDHKKATFITTNHTKAAFRSAFSEVLYDWIIQDTSVLTIRGESHRKKGQDVNIDEEEA